MSLLSLLKPFGIDIFCTGKKFLVFNLVSRNLKIKYHRSVLGLLWTLLTPAAMAAIFYFVFKVILNIQIPHYLIFILSGVMPWNFFSQSLAEGMESIVGNLGLISKVPVPLQIFPFVGSITNLVTLVLALPILLGAAWVSRVSLGPSIVMLLYYFPLLFLITYCLSLILAVAFVYFRDLRHLMGIGLQLWFYATPVIYDESMIPPKFRFVMWLNPMSSIFTGLHAVMVRGEWPEAGGVAAVGAWAMSFLLAALWAEKRYCHSLVETI